MELKSRNPFFGGKSYKSATDVYAADYEIMTVKGTVNKTFILFALLFAGAILPFYMLLQGINPYPAAVGSVIVAIIMVVVSSISPKLSPYTAPAYALFEGVFIGTVSLIFEAKYPGIVIQAVAGSLVTFGVCLALYRFGVVKVTEQFKSVVIAATLAICTYYLISALLGWIFGISLFHHGNSLVSIGFSIFVIIIAALNLILDFDLVEQGARRQLPKYMEWFAGMGLVITMVWLYVEFLRLLSKLQSRN
ncbi:Bax inhibitor-1/YccA family membrane protein [Flavobacterium sp. RHBU_3]|uniref:Bax inhibitor-1/YccA family protein n=1 Tax=Flavobacterium sp. RHBU_3 TaxID=3391184 RepID=UPI003985139C